MARRSCASNCRRFLRRSALSALTVTWSKKASTGARSFASACRAPSKSSDLQLFADLAFGAVERRGEGVFLRFDAQIGFRMFFKGAGAVLLLFGLEDVGRALVAGEQARAILGGQEFFQSIYARHDHHQVILPERENRVEQIVTGAAIA